MKCLIVSGGDKSLLPNEKYQYIIACDKGYQYCKELGIKPNIVLGDFDSYEGDFDETDEIITLPKEKDDTDTLYALKYAIEKGYKDIHIICALGGKRFDHLFSNIQLGNYAVNNGVDVKIIGDNENLLFIKNKSLDIAKDNNRYFSVFSLSNTSVGVDIIGAKYPLSNYVLVNSIPLGTSNEWVEEIVTINVKEGTLLIVTEK